MKEIKYFMSNIVSDKDTNLILLLYLLDKINDSISENNLYSLIKDVTDINYFEYKEILNHLENIFCIKISEKRHDDEDYTQLILDGFYEPSDLFISITKNGVDYLNLSKQILPGIVKLSADTHFNDNIKSFKEQASVKTSFKPIGSQYMISLSINDNYENLFKLNLLVGSVKNADKIIKNFKENPNVIYEGILDILNNTEKFKEEQESEES